MQDLHQKLRETTVSSSHTRSTHLKVVVKGDDVWVSARDALQHRDFVPDLRAHCQPAHQRPRRLRTHHMLPPLHELLVDDFAGIVLARLDVNRLLHDGIRPTTERLACAILITPESDSAVDWDG